MQTTLAVSAAALALVAAGAASAQADGSGPTSPNGGWVVQAACPGGYEMYRVSDTRYYETMPSRFQANTADRPDQGGNGDGLFCFRYSAAPQFTDDTLTLVKKKNYIVPLISTPTPWVVLGCSTPYGVRSIAEHPDWASIDANGNGYVCENGDVPDQVIDDYPLTG